MKSKLLLPILLSFAILPCASLLTSCATGSIKAPTAADVTTTVQKSLPYLRTSASLATTGVMLAIKPASRAQTASYISSACVGMRTLTGDTVPTAAQLKAVIAQFTTPKGATANPDAAIYQSLATSVVNLYSSVLPQLQGNAALAVQVIDNIASGCEDAVAPFLPAPTAASRSYTNRVSLWFGQQRQRFHFGH